MTKFLRESLGGLSITSTGLISCSAGSWLLSQDFPSALKGNHNRSCSATVLFALSSGHPETLFQNEFIMQKTFRKPRGWKRKGRGGSKMNCLTRWSGRDLPLTYKAGRSAEKGDAARELSGGVVQWLRRYCLGFSAQGLMTLERTFEFPNMRWQNGKLWCVNRILLVYYTSTSCWDRRWWAVGWEG